MVFDLYARDEAKAKGEEFKDMFSCIRRGSHQEVAAGLENRVDIFHYLSRIVYVFEYSVQGDEVRTKSEWGRSGEVELKEVRFLGY